MNYGIVKNTLKFQPFVCVCVRGSPCTANHAHTQQVGICRHNTGNAHINKHSGTILVILASH